MDIAEKLEKIWTDVICAVTSYNNDINCTVHFFPATLAIYENKTSETSTFMSI